MPGRKVVMLSSTGLDLPAHREQVRQAYERAGFEPREMMEHLTAPDTNAVDISLRMVDQADVYIDVLAYRYGRVVETLTALRKDLAAEANDEAAISAAGRLHRGTAIPAGR